MMSDRFAAVFAGITVTAGGLILEPQAFPPYRFKENTDGLSSVLRIKWLHVQQ